MAAYSKKSSEGSLEGVCNKSPSESWHNPLLRKVGITLSRLIDRRTAVFLRISATKVAKKDGFTRQSKRYLSLPPTLSLSLSLSASLKLRKMQPAGICEAGAGSCTYLSKQYQARMIKSPLTISTRGPNIQIKDLVSKGLEVSSRAYLVVGIHE